MKELIRLNWENPVSQKRNELVFENRFKDYGAYDIRKRYEKNTAIALLFSIALFALTVSVPIIAKLFSPDEKISKEYISGEFNLLQVLPEIPPEQIFTKPAQLQPVVATKEFITPVVVDEHMDDTQTLTQQELGDVTLANKTVDGNGADAGPITEPIIEDVDPNKVYMTVAEMPVFPGGDNAFVKYLNHVSYPIDARKDNIQGRVFVSFVVERDGSIGEVRLHHGVGTGGLDEAAINWIKKMPLWLPGKQNGQPVRVQFIVPFNFLLK